MTCKKISLACMILLALSLCSFGREISVEGKVLYFRPSCSCFSDIYDGGLYYGGEVSIDVWKNVGIWAGIDYFSKNGKLSFTEEETKLRITPVFLGVHVRLPLPGYQPYAGVGLGYFSYRESNPIGTVEDSNIGYIVLAGCRIRFARMFFFDVRGSYSRCVVKPAALEANLGGTMLGLGLGIEL